MPEYPRLTAKEAEKLLLRSGFVFDRQNVAIEFLLKRVIGWVLPCHAGKILHPKIIKQLFKVIDEAEPSRPE